MQPPEATILRELLARDGDFVSGSRLAELLEVSRVAIWSHMEKLRNDGFHFEARPRCGYRLQATPRELSPLFLQALLPAETAPVHFREEVDSTNSEAERLLAAGSPAPFVVVGRSQTRGRGRLGRRWHSGDSGNLYLSFAFQPGLPPQRMQSFTLWMGTAICHFLNTSERVPAGIKWPNDLLIDGRKLGGMLTEARVDSDQIRDLVFGLGLNVNGSREDLPAELREVATSIAALTGRTLCLNRFAAALLVRVFSAYREFVRGSHLSEFQELWPLYDTLAGKPVTARQGNLSHTGFARGIDGDGCLLIERPDRSTLRVSAGDVTLEKEAAS